jgi:hypothetical protein
MVYLTFILFFTQTISKLCEARKLDVKSNFSFSTFSQPNSFVYGFIFVQRYIVLVSFPFRTLLDSADHKVVISTSCLDKQDSVSDEPDIQGDPPRSTSVMSDRQRIQTIPDKMSCSPKEKSDSVNICEDGGRLSQSPVHFSGSLPVVREVNSPEKPMNVSGASAREVKADDSRSSSSYSMEFEDEEPEGGVVEVL